MTTTQWQYLEKRPHPWRQQLYINRDANRSKDMSFKAIVRAIANLEAANIPLANQFISLNQWNY